MICRENYIADKIKSKVREQVVLRSEIDNPYIEEYINNVIEVIVDELDELIDNKINRAIKDEKQKLINELRSKGIR